MTVSMIVACGKNGAIGYQNKLLWKIPEDMKHFKTVTMGHAVVMGRKTFESIGRPLPKRLNVVVSRNQNLKIKNVAVTDSLEMALKVAPDVFIIGGSEIYRQALKFVDEIWLTLVDDSPKVFDAYIDLEGIKKMGFKNKEVVQEIPQTQEHPSAKIMRVWKEV